jgi:hypothetical protein
MGGLSPKSFQSLPAALAARERSRERGIAGTTPLQDVDEDRPCSSSAATSPSITVSSGKFATPSPRRESGGRNSFDCATRAERCGRPYVQSHETHPNFSSYRHSRPSGNRSAPRQSIGSKENGRDTNFNHPSWMQRVKLASCPPMAAHQVISIL